MTHRTLTFVVFVAATLTSVSCATKPDIERAPLAEEGQKKLRGALVGSWQHEVTVEPSGGRQPVRGAAVVWTFRENGTGTYREHAESGDSSIRREFRWHLEGRNLFIEMKTDRNEYFRAETWSPRQMRWRNYRTENVLLLEDASVEQSGPSGDPAKKDATPNRTAPADRPRRTR